VKRRVLVGEILAAGLLGMQISAPAQPAPQFIPFTSAQLWHRLEFGITNVPAVANPFDPDQIRLDATFTLPSGGVRTVPAFWYQGYQRGLSGGYEYLTPIGSPHWRLRFAPPEAGTYSVALTILTNGQPYAPAAATNFTVPTNAASPGAGYVRVAASRQYFETGDGQALRLNGMNVGWYGGRGTYDYDDWFAAMQGVGMNFGRVLVSPWAFGMETDPDSLNHYRLDRAWQLDYVLQLAEQRDIHILLDVVLHLMLQPVPDIWGQDDYWWKNPYYVTNGGPCVNINAFFTNTTARTLFQKHLRYLIGRYGYSPRLMAWEFISEVDNEYAWVNAADVAAWHGLMGAWMRTNDPFGHLLTTSLTGGSDRPEIWSLPQLDFANYHCYGEAFPATRLNAVAQSFLPRYGKPVLVEEFGTSGLSWNHTNDPYLRGFRQGLWGGALGGSAGTAMSWWFENIHSENDYPIYAALGAVLNRTGWGRGTWTNVSFQTAGAPPGTVGDVISGGQAFNVVLVPGGVWGATPSGRLAVPDALATGYAGSTLNSFVQGSWQPALRIPFALNAWFTNNARVVVHLNSVSVSAAMAVRVDGALSYSTNLPNLDGLNEVNNEYNLDILLNLAPGKHLIEITNTASGWFYLDWVRLEQVLPASYASNWVPSPEAIGLRGPRESLLYIVAPGASFSTSSTNAVLPLQHGLTVTLTNWVAGSFIVEWYDPATALPLGGGQASALNAGLTLPLPDFREDLAAIVFPPPTLAAPGVDGAGGFRFRLDSEPGGRYLVEKSQDLATWDAFAILTNAQGTAWLTDPGAVTNGNAFYRARQNRQ
jgi:hypothetical protein